MSLDNDVMTTSNYSLCLEKFDLIRKLSYGDKSLFVFFSEEELGRVVSTQIYLFDIKSIRDSELAIVNESKLRSQLCSVLLTLISKFCFLLTVSRRVKLLIY